MRELIINHVSFYCRDSDLMRVVSHVLSLTRGIAQIIDNELASPTLRSSYSLSEIYCFSDVSFYDVIFELQRKGYKDEFSFLIRLATKTPLDFDIDSNIVDRFRGCENTELPDEDGRPLVLCAISEGIAVSLPSESIWDQSNLKVKFIELLPDELISESVVNVDNVARFVHSQEIINRMKLTFIEQSQPAQIWQNRNLVYPNLVFGPEVAQNLEEEANVLSTILRKIKSLDDTAAEWQSSDSTMPRWRTFVTNESESTRTDTKNKDARTFKSHGGVNKEFLWHARYGNSGRIHLHFDPETKIIEIGYIGRHLPI